MQDNKNKYGSPSTMFSFKDLRSNLTEISYLSQNRNYPLTVEFRPKNLPKNSAFSFVFGQFFCLGQPNTPVRLWSLQPNNPVRVEIRTGLKGDSSIIVRSFTSILFWHNAVIFMVPTFGLGIYDFVNRQCMKSYNTYNLLCIHSFNLYYQAILIKWCK